MKRNDYHIKISFDKESLLVEDCKDVPYLNSRGRGDIFKFHPHDITIETNRLPVYQKDDVLTNTSNSIYQQISKALLLCYAVNLCDMQLRSITVIRKGEDENEQIVNLVYTKDTQPLKGQIDLPVSLETSRLHVLLHEDAKAVNLRNVLSHWLMGMAAVDRNYRFERLWRAFEQLAFCFYGAEDKHNESLALRNMRQIFLGNPHLFPRTQACVSDISSMEFLNFHWRRMILDTYPKS